MCSTFLGVGRLTRALRLEPLAPAVDALAEQLAAAGSTWELGSGSDLEQVRAAGPYAAAAFGINLDSTSIDRATAMTIPAVRRGRQVICGTIGSLALRASRTYAGVVDDVSDRPLLVQPDPNTTRSWLLTWLVDDLLFHGVAWWEVLDLDAQGFPTQVRRVTKDRVRLDEKLGVAYVDGKRAAPGQLVRFDGPDEGVLTYGGRTLRTCLALDEAVRRFARLDVPLGLLRPAEGAPELTDDEVAALLDDWEAARAARSTGYLNRALDYERLQFDANEVGLHDARQQQAAEVARLLNLSPRYVNAPNASGMTYSNVVDERRDLVDTSLNGYMAAITDRLSMPDLTPRGTVVTFDTSALLRGDLGTALEAARLAVELGAMTRDEVRTDVLGRPALPASERTATP